MKRKKLFGQPNTIELRPSRRSSSIRRVIRTSYIVSVLGWARSFVTRTGYSESNKRLVNLSEAAGAAAAAAAAATVRFIENR